MSVLNETLTVLGTGLDAPALMLREALRFKTRSGSLIVQDTTGRGAELLSPGIKMGLDRKRVIWVDVADRRRPVSLFQVKRSVHLRSLWARVLKSLSTIAKVDIADAVINWAADAAYRLSSDGSVGLGALFRCLSSAETRHWFLESKIEPSGLGKLLDMLTWVLSFPAVYAISEGENRGNILDALSKPSVLWIEAPIEHFEPKEHAIVQLLVEASLEDVLRTMAASGEQYREIMRGLTLLHLYPDAHVALPIEGWVDTHLGLVRHVSVHRLDPERPLSAQALSWVQRAESLWFTGHKVPIDPKCHAAWLSDVEAARLHELTGSELWIKSNRTGKAIVARVRERTSDLALAARLRNIAVRRRRAASLDQVAASVKSFANPPDSQRDLYARLCDVEVLRAGWFRVQESKTRAFGVDGITATAFGVVVEKELKALSDELRAGRYCPKPLRRIQIPKLDGGIRNLGVACIRDRVVQAACLSMLEPIYEPTFSRFSYGFRPHRNAHQAVAVARSFIASGRQWAVIADIRKCFDTIDHDVLLGILARRIADDEFLALVRNWLTVDVAEFGDLLPNEIGVPQGESISPLLANIYLDQFDRHFEAMGIPFVRYADDFVIFARSKEAAEDICQRLADFLHDVLRLELKPAKTFYVPVSEGFDFLGFHITDGSLTVKLERIEVLLQQLSDLIKTFAASGGALDKAAECLSRFNSIARGWRNYFLLPGESALVAQMRDLDDRIEQTAAIHLPDFLRENPAWLCRERMAVLPPHALPASAGRPSQSASQAASGYPEVESADDSSWTIQTETGIRRDSTSLDVRRNGNFQHSNRGAVNATPLLTTTLEDGDRLYVLTHGAFIGIDGTDVILRKRRVEIYRRSLDQISLIYLQGYGMNISVEAQIRLAERDVPVVIALPLGNPVAVVTPIETSRSSVRRLQAVRREEPDVVKAGLSMISAKVSNQAAVLKYFSKYRSRTAPDTASCMRSSADEILDLSQKAIRLDPSEANVRGMAMGLEGRAAAIYWNQLAQIIPSDFGFAGRITLSAEDPVNQCLNYVYGVLYGEVWRAVVKAGLDPYFGVMHGSLRDQGSLVFDLIEEFRAPFGDRVVMGMLGRGFKPEIGKHGLLRSSSKHLLLQSFIKRWTKGMEYRSRTTSPSKLLGMQAMSLVNVFKNEGSYRPFRMKW
jgi:RNA-directed DNA polymerase